MYQKVFRGITFINAFIGEPHVRHTNNTTVFDFDGTIILSDKSANWPVIAEAIRLKAEGYMLILSTARGDKRWKGSWSADKIEIIAEEIAEDLHSIGLQSLFDEVHIGMKAYSNHSYVDDKSVHTSAIKPAMARLEQLCK